MRRVELLPSSEEEIKSCSHKTGSVLKKTNYNNKKNYFGGVSLCGYIKISRMLLQALEKFKLRSEPQIKLLPGQLTGSSRDHRGLLRKTDPSWNATLPGIGVEWPIYIRSQMAKKIHYSHVTNIRVTCGKTLGYTDNAVI